MSDTPKGTFISNEINENKIENNKKKNARQFRKRHNF